jgi:magnesium-transporting ATPase (P-type)
MTFVAFVLLQVPLPLLVVQVLAIDLGMDVLPSLALTMEPPEPDVMRKPPRRAGSRLIDPTILVKALYVGIVMSVGALFWAFRTWMATGWAFGQMTVNDPQVYARGTTIVMAGIIAGQLGNLFSARSSSESAFRMSPLKQMAPSRNSIAGCDPAGIGVRSISPAAIQDRFSITERLDIPLRHGSVGTLD